MDLTVTDFAKEKMSFYLKDKNLDEWGIRILVRMEGEYAFSISELSKALETDEIIDLDGMKVMIDDISAKQLEGATVDFVESELSTGFKVDLKPRAQPTPSPEINLSDPTTKKVYDILTNEINPGIAMHGGVARLVSVKDNVVHLQFGGGCHGCGMVDVTLKQGIETRIKEAIPEIVAVVDETDHDTGNAPYYQPSQ